MKNLLCRKQIMWNYKKICILSVVLFFTCKTPWLVVPLAVAQPFTCTTLWLILPLAVPQPFTC